MPKHLHERRGIEFNELVILLGIREALAMGLIINGPDPWEKSCDLAGKGNHVFNISGWQTYKDCGTVGCIGGYMAMVSDDSFDYIDAEQKDHPLHALFFPPDTLDWSTITPDKAVKAIDNWLKTGRPNWAKIPGVLKHGE